MIVAEFFENAMIVAVLSFVERGFRVSLVPAFKEQTTPGVMGAKLRAWQPAYGAPGPPWGMIKDQ